MLQIFGLIVGILIGVMIPVEIPTIYSNYVAVAIMAALDSIFGGIAATLQKKFDMKIFLTGFFGNAILAAFLAWIGDKLGIQIYLAAIFVFGNRMFLNFGISRRILLSKKNDKAGK